ncbi:ROK family transcriptional regulator [Thalassospira marina]|nr:ROK family transcriptional regulator [Thalassospira marina]
MPKTSKKPDVTQLPIGNNPERSRSHNRRVVLDAIRSHGMMGRTQIAKLAHLSPQAVTNIVDELVADGLLIEKGRLRSGRGQPPIQFAVNPDGAFTVGIEIAADHLVLVALDMVGTLRAERVMQVENTDPDHVIPIILLELAKLRGQTGIAPERLQGIGLVMPGPFEIDGMTSVGPTTLPGWQGKNPATLLSDATGEDVVLENDASAAAVGERFFGAAQAISSFGLVYFGAGLGLGIIHEGRPYRGAYGNAGEIGHAVSAPGGRECTCGQRGCLERYASLYALYEKLSLAGRDRPDFAGLIDLYRQNDPIMDEWLSEASLHLAPMLSTLENILDPETIILGGALPDEIVDELISRINPLPMSVSTRAVRTQPRLMRGHTGQLTAALGAATLPLWEIMTPKLDTKVSAPLD